jgi:hypothetical protein
MQSAIAPENVTFSQPTVVPTETGMVIRVNEKNKDFGYILLRQVRNEFSEEGFIEEKPITCLVKGHLASLKRLKWTPWQQLKGKIVVQESLEPFREKSIDYDIKMSSREGGVMLVHEDQPIFRRTFYSVNPEKADTYIKHTNVDEVRAAVAAKADVKREEFATADLD